MLMSNQFDDSSFGTLKKRDEKDEEEEKNKKTWNK